jgi:microcystin-dependent protein
MSDQYLGEVRCFGFNFPPKGWAFCDGQLMILSQNTALFALLGTTYGGDGKSNFGLPNLQGNIPIGQGQGSGLNPYFIGEASGSPTVTLLQSEMPSHNHNLMTDPDDAPPNAGLPTNNALCTGPATTIYSTAASPLVQMYPLMLQPMGNSLPHNNMMPFLVLNFCIALQGVFPPRS